MFLKNYKIHMSCIFIIIFLTVNTLISANIDATRWYSFVIPWNDTTNSSINPSNSVLDAPAGKYGFITVKDGHFYFQNGKRIRFWGANLCFSANFPTHEQSEVMAAHLAKYGFNAIRLHHMDTNYAPKGIFDPTNKNTQLLDKTQLDRLDYLVYQLKQRGIYVNFNLLVGRKFTNNESNISADKGSISSEFISIFDPELIILQKNYANSLLNRVNSYTGIKYTQDPAVAMLEIVNENSIFDGWSMGYLNLDSNDSIPEYYTKELDKLWNNWLIEKYQSQDNLSKAWNSSSQFKDNLIVNEDFSTGFEKNWITEVNVVGGAKANFSLQKSSKNKFLSVDISRIGNEDYMIQLKKIGLPLKKEYIYDISFKAKANISRQISLSYMKDISPWNNYGLSKTFDINQTWKEYKVSFKCTSSDLTNSRFAFSLGSDLGNISLDDIAIKEVSKIGLESNESLSLQNIKRQLFSERGLYFEQRNIDLVNFYYSLENNFNTEMLSYLKNTLDIKAPISSGSGYYGPQNLLAQTTGDYLNAHGYWDHPKFPNISWDSSDFIQHNDSIIQTDYALKNYFTGLMQSAIYNKPIIVSEWNIPFPNQYEYEIPMLMASYAAKQDWDGLFVFAYSHSSFQDSNRILPFFDIVNSPSKLSQMLPCSIAFISGYIPKNPEIVVNISQDSILNEFGIYNSNSKWSDILNLPGNILDNYSVRVNITKSSTDTPEDIAKKIINTPSHNSDLKLIAGEKPYIVIQSPKVQGLLGGAQKAPIDLPNLSMTLMQNASAYLISLDNLPISTSKHLLLTVVGRQQNQGQINSTTTNNLIQLGTGSSTLERIEGNVNLNRVSKIKVYALNSIGSRINKTPIESGSINLSVYDTPWYEICYE